MAHIWTFNQVKQVPWGTCVEPLTTPTIPYYVIPNNCWGSNVMDKDPTSSHILLPAHSITGEVMMNDGLTSPPTLSFVIPVILDHGGSSIGKDLTPQLTLQPVTLGIPLESVQMGKELTLSHLNDIAMDHCTTAIGSPLCSSSSIPQPSTTPSPSNHLTSSRLLPSPPVPTALADIIGKAVANHLSSGLVELTI